MSDIAAEDQSVNARDLWAPTRRHLGSSINVRELSELSPWRGPATVAFEWVLIVATVIVAVHWSPWYTYPLSVAVIGSRQHALLVLMHEAAHYRLSSIRRVNEWVGDFLAAWPFFVTMARYRSKHLAHHRCTGTITDPNWVSHRGDSAWNFPMARHRFAWSLASTALLLDFAATVDLLRRVNEVDDRYASAAASQPADAHSPRDWRSVVRPAIYIAVTAAIIFSGVWLALLLFWVIPMATYLRVVMRIRAVAEHYGIDPETPQWPATRSTRVGILGRIFLLPRNIHFHVEHHLFPSVPYYRLPALSEAIRETDPITASEIHETRGFRQLFTECTAPVTT